MSKIWIMATPPPRSGKGIRREKPQGYEDSALRYRDYLAP